MKKTLLIGVLLVVFSFGYGQKITGGIKFSPVLSWMKPAITKDITNEGLRFGFNFGIGGDLNLSDNFAFTTGILVNNFGGKLKYADSIPAFTVDQGTTDSTYSFTPGVVINYKMQYIEIPIAIKGKTNEIGYMTYFMKAGISPMFKWQAKADVSQGNISNESIKGEVASFMLGFNVGAGFEYSLGGNTKILCELVYNNGLTDITKTDVYKASDNKIGNEKVILNSVALRLGILF